ncbi:MAG: hypothetical protein B7X58_07680, partial [Marinobacter sp. 34-60-7]
ADWSLLVSLSILMRTSPNVLNGQIADGGDVLACFDFQCRGAGQDFKLRRGEFVRKLTAIRI